MRFTVFNENKYRYVFITNLFDLFVGPYDIKYSELVITQGIIIRFGSIGGGLPFSSLRSSPVP